MPTPDLTPEQTEQTEQADRIYQTLRQAIDAVLRDMAALLASNPTPSSWDRPNSRSATAS